MVFMANNTYIFIQLQIKEKESWGAILTYLFHAFDQVNVLTMILMVSLQLNS
jgi:hypothetical protein